MHDENANNGSSMEQSNGHARSRVGVAMEILSPSALKKTVTQLWGNVSHKAAGAWSSVSGTYSPCADVIEEATQFVITMEVPGVDAGTLDVTFANGILTVKGEKCVSRTGREVRLRERAEGKFERGIDVGYPIDSEALDAEMANGILTVRLRKMVAPQGGETKVRVRGN